MKREGKVIGINKDRAKVALRKHSACGDCGACQLGEENMEMEIDAINVAKAEIGDNVEIDMASPNVLTAAFLAYGLPLISLIIGVVLSNKVFEIIRIEDKNIEIYSLLSGILLMVIAYGYIKHNEKNIKNNSNYVSKITRILD